MVPDCLNDEGTLAQAKSLVRRARKLYKALFQAAKDMPEWGRMLATCERLAQFEAKLLQSAKGLNQSLNTMLPDAVVQEVMHRLAETVAVWEHSPDRQRARQKKQAASRRRKNRGRDLQIVRLYESAESQRRIAARFGISRGAVEHVLLRDAPLLLKRREKPSPPD